MPKGPKLQRTGAADNLARIRSKQAQHKTQQQAKSEESMPSSVETRRTRRVRRGLHGFSLIELLIVLAVMGVLAASALPHLGASLQRQQLTNATNELVLAVYLAQSEARARGKRSGIAPIVDGDWASGWRVFVDANGNGQLDDDEAVVHELNVVPQGLRIAPHFGAYRGNVLSFDPIGNLRRPGSSGYVLGRITLALGDEVRALCFSTLSVRTVRAAKCERS
jgi:type IV fimbrial biogenesis protein FimT